jgi:uncharacterized protein (DUF2141 family)
MSKHTFTYLLTLPLALAFFTQTNRQVHQSQLRGSLVVNVKCKHNEGRVQCYLYASPTGWLKSEPATQKIAQAAISNQMAIIVFRDIPYGKYALSMLHDFNRNDDMDYNMIGMPTEGWGFSNKRPPVLIKPSFQECSFEINAPSKTLNLEMTYL